MSYLDDAEEAVVLTRGKDGRLMVMVAKAKATGIPAEDMLKMFAAATVGLSIEFGQDQENMLDMMTKFRQASEEETAEEKDKPPILH